MPPIIAIAACWLAIAEPFTQPSHVLDFSDIGELYSAVLSPDGSRLYVLVHAPLIDVGGLVAHFWPEWGGLLALLLSVPLIWMIVRRLRRQQRDGDPYCRRCNYNLSSPAPDQNRCPECGVDLAKRPPIRGRRALKRAAKWLAMLAAVLTAYGLMWAFRVPRGAAWLNPGWTSTSARKLLDRRGFEWLMSFRGAGDVIIEVDARTGARLRTVCQRASTTYFHLVLTPDGSGLYLNNSNRNGLDLVSVSTGNVTTTFRPPPAKANSRGKKAPGRGDFCYDIGGSVVISHTRDGSAVLSYWSDISEQATAAVWNPATGALTQIATTPVYIDNSTGRAACWGRRFVRVGTVEPVQVISVPLFMEAYPTKSYVVRWFDPSGNQSREVDLKTSVSSHAAPVVLPEGDLAIFIDEYGRRLTTLDLRTGKEAEPLVVADDFAVESPVLTPDGRLLIGGFKAIRVGDPRRKEWTAALAPPAGFYGPGSISSPTPTRAAAVFQGPATGLGGYAFRAAIWDLPPEHAEDMP